MRDCRTFPRLPTHSPLTPARRPMPQVDVPWKYLNFFLEDDAALAEIGREYESGRMLTGEPGAARGASGECSHPPCAACRVLLLQEMRGKQGAPHAARRPLLAPCWVGLRFVFDCAQSRAPGAPPFRHLVSHWYGGCAWPCSLPIPAQCGFNRWTPAPRSRPPRRRDQGQAHPGAERPCGAARARALRCHGRCGGCVHGSAADGPGRRWQGVSL